MSLGRWHVDSWAHQLLHRSKAYAFYVMAAAKRLPRPKWGCGQALLFRSRRQCFAQNQRLIRAE
jgi:hypothetical protein